MRKATYFYGKQSAPLSLDTLLACVPHRYVPFVIEALEARKSPAVFETQEDYAIAYNAICAIQWGLLMDAKEDIIQEIRGIRGPGPFDTTTYPVGTFPGTSLNDIQDRLGGPFANIDAQLSVIRGLLEEIRDNGGVASEGQLDALLQIVALLSV